MKTSRIFACVVLLVGAASLSAQTTVLPAGDATGSDWPQWAGPNGSYTSPEKGLLREWPEGGPKVLWKANVSQGWSAPSISGDDVIYAGSIMGGGDSDRETIVCLDAKTGKERWNYTYEVGGHYYQYYVGWPWGGVRATPFVTDKYVYSLGVIGKMVCLDRKGKLVWEKDLGKDYWSYLASKQYHEWKGAYFSPIVSEGVVLVPFTCDLKGNGNRCVGLDAETGKQKWVFPENTPLVSKDYEPGYRTPVLATFGKDRCAIIGGYFPCQFIALRLSDGKKVWEYNDKIHGGIINYYIVGNQLIFSTMLQNISLDIDFTTAPFATKIASVTENRALMENRGGNAASYHGVVASGGAVYGIAMYGDANALPLWEGELKCWDRITGKQLWSQKGFKSGASMIGADGLLFARSFQSLYLIEASPKGYVQKGKVEKLHDVTNANGHDGGWVMPVLSRGKLYVRTPGELICYKVSKD